MKWFLDTHSHDLASLASCFIYFACMRAKKGHQFLSAFLCVCLRKRQGQMVMRGAKNMRPQSFSLFQICFDSSNWTMIVCMLSFTLSESKYHTHMANGSYVMHENSHELVCKRERERRKEKFLLLQNRKGSYENSNTNSVKNVKDCWC
jgi:hypothetical protein